MRLCSSFVGLALTSVAFAQYKGSDAPPADLKAGFNTISVKDAKRVLTFLSTECDGRGTGQPGYEKASLFVAREFKKLGLKPLGDRGTFLQTTQFTRWRFDPKFSKIEDGGRKPAVSPNEISIQGGPAKLDLSAEPVWVEVTALDYDLGPSRFDGKIVILESPNRNPSLESEIAARGAVAILRVAPTVVESTWKTAMGKVSPRMRSFPTGTLAKSAADRLIGALGSSAQPSVLSSGIEVLPFTAKIDLEGALAVETVNVGNVVAELPGSDPKLADEYVGVGGHLDHLGDNDGVIYPGADDDGSGSTAVIEIARAMVANPKKPRRSIVFMTFFGEEMGLLGSRFLTQHPPIPLDHMVAELQMDMVGRDSDGVQNGDRSRIDVAGENVDTIRLVGSKRISTELDRDIQDENKYIGFRFKYDAEDVYTRSDHYNFAAKGIPIAFLFDGFHPDYHRPTDTIEKIDWAKLTNAAKLYYLTAHAVADSDAAPIKDVK